MVGEEVLGGRGSCRAEKTGKSGDGQVGKSGEIWAHREVRPPLGLNFRTHSGYLLPTRTLRTMAVGAPVWTTVVSHSGRFRIASK